MYLLLKSLSYINLFVKSNLDPAKMAGQAPKIKTKFTKSMAYTNLYDRVKVYSVVI